MRIISQNKTVDTPYDGAVVYVHNRMGNHIYVGNVGNDEGFPIGMYNSKEDAVYVVSLIRTAFMCNHKYFYMPEAKDVSAIRAKMKSDEESLSSVQLKREKGKWIPEE